MEPDAADAMSDEGIRVRATIRQVPVEGDGVGVARGVCADDLAALSRGIRHDPGAAAPSGPAGVAPSRATSTAGNG